nr:nickel-dependent hydrogenase b-type cytochrome subunit [uncultured bacterium]
MSTARPDTGSIKARMARVWDLPVRLFHWTLVALVVFSFTTGKIGGNWIAWHMYSGYLILALVVFRVIWGLIGSDTARFSGFIRGPAHVISYARSLLGGPPQFHAGHNPLGGLMVVLMLVLLLVQASTGLFVDDEISTRGPLADKVADATVFLLTKIHRININILLVCVALHVSAALFYLFVKKDNLIVPMFTGIKQVPGEHPEPAMRHGVIAFIVIALALGFVIWLVKVYGKG